MADSTPDTTSTPVPVILVVDIGSSSVRCSLHSATDLSLFRDSARVRWKHQLSPDVPPQQIVSILDAVDKLVDTLLADHGNDIRVIGAGFSSFVMNLLGVNAAGHPVTPLFHYARGSVAGVSTHVDKLKRIIQAGARRGSLSTGKMMDEMNGSGGSIGSSGSDAIDEHLQRTGTPIHGSYAPAQLAAYADSCSFEKIITWQTLSSLLLARWNGVVTAPISVSEASFLGLLNRKSLVWDEQTLMLLPPTAVTKLTQPRSQKKEQQQQQQQQQQQPITIHTSMWPRIADTSDHRSVGEIYAKRWPAMQNCRICPGVGDGAAANIGAGCTDSSRICVTIGTSAAIRIVIKASTQPIRVPRGLWCYRVDNSRELIGGALTDGASVVQWLERFTSTTFGNIDFANALKLDSETQQGLMVLPFFSGERAPGWRDDARGSIIGLDASTTPVQLLRAMIDGVAMRLGCLFDLIYPLANSGFGGSGNTSNVNGHIERNHIPETSGSGFACGSGCVICDDGGCGGKVTVVGSGGALINSELWGQIVCNSLGEELEIGTEPETSSLGVGMLVREALQVTHDVFMSAPSIEKVFYPIEAEHKVCVTERARQQFVHESLLVLQTPHGGRGGQQQQQQQRQQRKIVETIVEEDEEQQQLMSQEDKCSSTLTYSRRRWEHVMWLGLGVIVGTTLTLGALGAYLSWSFGVENARDAVTLYRNFDRYTRQYSRQYTTLISEKPWMDHVYEKGLLNRVSHES